MDIEKEFERYQIRRQETMGAIGQERLKNLTSIRKYIQFLIGLAIAVAGAMLTLFSSPALQNKHLLICAVVAMVITSLVGMFFLFKNLTKDSNSLAELHEKKGDFYDAWQQLIERYAAVNTDAAEREYRIALVDLIKNSDKSTSEKKISYLFEYVLSGFILGFIFAILSVTGTSWFMIMHWAFFYNLNFWSAIVGFMGTVILFIFGLPPKIVEDGRINLILEQVDEEEKQKAKMYKLVSYLGLFLIAISFFLQLLNSLPQ